ncbi:MAG: virulence factor SrfB [Bacteroidales bacterium]|nr:virulence factor SrfB [Bacteroidales bacterium]
MDTFSLIANSGIQFYTTKFKIEKTNSLSKFYHEWTDSETNECFLEPVYEIKDKEAETNAYYKLKDLLDKGLLADIEELTTASLAAEGIHPFDTDEDMNVNNQGGKIWKAGFEYKDKGKNFILDKYINKWLPLPYLIQKQKPNGEYVYRKFEALNWCRMKLIPIEGTEKEYTIVLAFDTRAKESGALTENERNSKEFPVFKDAYSNEIDFGLCNSELLLMDYCSKKKEASYVHEYLFHLVYPDLTDLSQLRNNAEKPEHRYAFITTYLHLISYLSINNVLPTVRLFRNENVPTKGVDLIVDIGNSKTTALVIEENNFNEVRPIQLQDYTDLVCRNKDGEFVLQKYKEPFDMRLAFRKVNFGGFGISNSCQFAYPSFIRLGQEATNLIHKSTYDTSGRESLSTYSSPKRYLWDWKQSENEWQFLTLEGEPAEDRILYIPCLSEYLKSSGEFSQNGRESRSFNYSRRSLMTFAFLEMINQAHCQINSSAYRNTTGNSSVNLPRQLKNIVVTCPTAMSKLEREALVKCAKDAASLFEKFYEISNLNIAVYPNNKKQDENPKWYFDEATCSQLVYMYGEVGYKYKGCCQEFFNLYGKAQEGEQAKLTVGSFDIGAGTSDLMINEYSYVTSDGSTKITPVPKFYDSFYHAGDDMLKELITKVMLNDENSAIRKKLTDLSLDMYRQLIKDFFGHDHNQFSFKEKLLRKNINIQYSVPLMSYFLNLLNKRSNDCEVGFNDVFENSKPNMQIFEDFKIWVNGWLERNGLKKCDIDLQKLEWKYNAEQVEKIVFDAFEPLLRKVATIMHAQSCDIILLSGRPASLAPVRDIFLKYYAIAPNRLIVLNNYYVGDWYPFAKNTGYITDPKTIVAMGGAVGYYSSNYQVLNQFKVDTSGLDSELQSSKTIQYVEKPRVSNIKENLLSPTNDQGTITISALPACLTVKQIDLDFYPRRALYSIDFNRSKIFDRLKRTAQANGESIQDTELQRRVNEEINRLKSLMPFKVDIQRDSDDNETLSITSILGHKRVNGEDEEYEVTESNIEIHIQSLGKDEESLSEEYWLDSGSFDF